MSPHAPTCRMTMDDIALKNQRLLIREDFNVPMENGRITSDTRLRAALPTIRQALDGGAAVILVSHFGRPQAGKPTAEFSLAPIAKALAGLLGQDVPLVTDWQDGLSIQPGQVVLLENIRFHAGETSNDLALAKQLASLCDVFVMDAFATAHRAHASTVGVAGFVPKAVAGPLLEKELAALSTALDNPKKPLLVIVGGSKVSSKLNLLENLTKQVDQLIVGGGIANTLIAAKSYPIGQSLYEPDLIPAAKALFITAADNNTQLPLPTDVIVAKEISPHAVTHIKLISELATDDKIVDIGPTTIDHYCELIAQAGTIVWNGPVGIFELAPFSAGTHRLAMAIASSRAFSIAGGGDTLAAIEKWHLGEQIDYISTGGGAFLEFLEGKILPGVAALSHK